jgi:small subunit ribosomal protein S18
MAYRENRMNSGDRDDRMGSREERGVKLLEGVTDIDYKDAELLRKFMTERGKILSRRYTGVTSKQQREVKRAIRRARVMGLLR